MLTVTELHQLMVQDQELMIYTLTDDAIFYLGYCLERFKGYTKKDYLSVCQYPGELFNDLRTLVEKGQLKAFYTRLAQELLEGAVYGRDIRYDNLLTAYDITVGICFIDDLYILFSSRVSIFPYQTQRLFLKAIELSFGDPYDLPQELIIPLLDYLKSDLALFQARTLEQQRLMINDKAPVACQAPLNVAGEYCTQRCESLLERFSTRYGPHWKDHLNFVSLLQVLSG